MSQETSFIEYAPRLRSMQALHHDLLPRFDIRAQVPVKSLAFDRHVDLVEGVLHDIVRVQLIDPANGDIYIGLKWLGKEQKLRPRQRMEALQPEVFALEHFNAGGWDARSWDRG